MDIATWIMTLLTLAIGYGMGMIGQRTEGLGEVVKRTMKQIRRPELGAVKTLSKPEMDRVNNPRIQAEEEAWEETIGRQINGNSKTTTGS